MEKKLIDIIRKITEIIDALNIEWSNKIIKKEIRTGKYSLEFKDIIGDKDKLESIRHEVNILDNVRWVSSEWSYGKWGKKINKVTHSFIVDFDIPLKYSYEDKMHKIGTIKLIEGNKKTSIPIYRVILNHQWKDDLEIMEVEESKYGIAYSDYDDYEGFGKSLDVEYNINFSIDFIDKMRSGFTDGIIDIEGWWHFRNTGLRKDTIYKNPNYYFNNVEKEDEENIAQIKKDIEKYTNIKVEYSIHNRG